jgi:RND family efflux transporter MFP subunit
MPDAEPRRADLSALKIHRDDEEREGVSIVRIVVWIIVLGIVGAAAWLGYTKVVVPRSAPTVETTVVKPSVNVANPPLLTASGYLVASRTAKITPKISGKVVQLNVDTGVDVKKGDVIAVLESTYLKAQLDESQAQLDQARREYDRQAALWQQGVTSKSLLDSAESQLKSAKARVDAIRINMQDMIVRAPFDGTVAAKNTEVGEVVSSIVGQVSGTLPTGAICTLVDLKTIEVEADINEQSISQLHEGQPAEVTVDAFPNRKWKGQLRQIIPTADRAKAIVQVKVAILNPDARLLPEMAANVSFLNTARSDADLTEAPRMWLPPGAVVDGRVATVDATTHVVWKDVKTGPVREGRVEILSGIKDGDRIVAQGSEVLKQGQLVRLPDNM